MEVCHILERARQAELTLRLNEGGGLNVSPRHRITPALRELFVAYKSDLVSALRQQAPPPAADDLWLRLEAIANKCCDHWQDSAERRAEMLHCLRAMTSEWQRHWLDHLEASYGNPK
jgi:hypothetical protein